MDTPGPPDSGDVRTIYGGSKHSINRRALVAGAALLAATPASARRTRPVLAIAWTGRAKVFQDDGDLDLTVRTRVEPFRRARSTSWITAKGEATARTLVIEPETGWLEQGGARKPLPPALIAHERQQYGVYAYLLGLGDRQVSDGVVEASHPGFPPIRMGITADGRVGAADYTVGSPEDGRPVPERFVFEGVTTASGVRWFELMTIDQGGRPYFQLRIDGFDVERG